MRYVLYVCTHDAGRSQMAQAFFERYAPDDLRAESAGSHPAEAVWPEVVRRIRDDVEARVKKLLAEHADDIRADGTAHRRRLQRLLPQLVAEFGDAKPPEEIRACTDAMLARFDDAAVCSFVEPHAQRQTWNCLSAPTCEALAS